MEFHQFYDYPLVMINIAMENGPFIDDFPIKTSSYTGFCIAMLNNQMVTHLYIAYFLYLR